MRTLCLAARVVHVVCLMYAMPRAPCAPCGAPCVPCVRQTSPLDSFVKDRPTNEPLCGRFQANLIKEPSDGYLCYNLNSRNNLERSSRKLQLDSSGAAE